MLNRILAITVLMVSSMGFSQALTAEEAVTANANVVVYRSDRSFKADRVSMHLSLSGENLGRLNSGDNLVVSRPAGEYTVGSSVKGSKVMLIELKPGKTHYVHADVGLRGTQVKVRFAEVEEQVAREHYQASETNI